MMKQVTDQVSTEDVARAIRAQYELQLQAALRTYASATHQLTRASHEVKRLEKHLAKIDAFCKENNVAPSA